MALNDAINNGDELLRSYINEMETLKKQIKNKISNPVLIEKAEAIRQNLLDLEIQLNGNELITNNMELIAPSIASRVSRVRYSFNSSTSASTMTQKQSFAIALKEYNQWTVRFNNLNKEINELENALSNSGIIIQSGKQDINWKN
jgi:hypothetical protein